MTNVAFVIVVLFSMPDGSMRAMPTLDRYQTPLACSMRAHIENLKADDRTYVCMASEHAQRMMALQVTANERATSR